jgi:predicted RNase H-like HicB family nuclease
LRLDNREKVGINPTYGKPGDRKTPERRWVATELRERGAQEVQTPGEAGASGAAFPEAQNAGRFAAQHFPAGGVGLEVNMLYAVYLHVGDDEHSHGVTIPDFPGCFAAAESWDELPKMIQQAAEVHFEGEDMEIPAPTPMDQLMEDPSFEGGTWMLVDIDLSRIPQKGSS